jgi:hypothetical protein
MLEWHSRLSSDLLKVMRGDTFWEPYLDRLTSSNNVPVTLHLAVMIEPYLRFLLSGAKTVESRFSVNRCAPYEQVNKGDVILLKKSGGPVVGLCQVAHRWFYRLNPNSWRAIKQEFAEYLCIQDPTFWKERESASFATLIKVQHVRSITPIKVEKRDRRGWVVLQNDQSNISLPLWSNKL